MKLLPYSVAEITRRLRAAGCVFAEDEAQVLVTAAASTAELEAMLDRRIAGLPLEHVVGWAEFCGLRIWVDPGVFVPRRRTEFLAGEAVALLRLAVFKGQGAGGPEPRPAVVVDLCCGSGALGTAIAAAGENVELHAADIESAAVVCARRNVVPVGGSVYQGDLFEPLPDSLRGSVDLLVVNAPYVPTEAIATMPPEARIHEPLIALDGGRDGLDVQRRVIAEAPQWLARAGHLLIETSAGQCPLTVALMSTSGLIPVVACSPELAATVVIGRSGGT